MPSDGGVEARSRSPSLLQAGSRVGGSSGDDGQQLERVGASGQTVAVAAPTTTAVARMPRCPGRRMVSSAGASRIATAWTCTAATQGKTHAAAARATNPTPRGTNCSTLRGTGSSRWSVRRAKTASSSFTRCTVLGSSWPPGRPSVQRRRWRPVRTRVRPLRAVQCLPRGAGRPVPTGPARASRSRCQGVRAAAAFSQQAARAGRLCPPAKSH